jgi:hypothetical protein
MGSSSKQQRTMAEAGRERALKGVRERQQQKRPAAAAPNARGRVASRGRIERSWAVRPRRVRGRSGPGSRQNERRRGRG